MLVLVEVLEMTDVETSGVTVDTTVLVGAVAVALKSLVGVIVAYATVSIHLVEVTVTGGGVEVVVSQLVAQLVNTGGVSVLVVVKYFELVNQMVAEVVYEFRVLVIVFVDVAVRVEVSGVTVEVDKSMEV